MTLELFTNPMSRGQIAHWMLEELGQPYDTHWIEYGPTGHRSPDYLALNPMGKIPALRHDGHVVTETAAIILYLADMFPEAGLKPGEPAKLADYYRWFLFAAGPFEQAVTTKAAGWTPPEDKQGMLGFGTFELAVDTLADWFDDREFVCGDMFTAADVYVGSHVAWGLMFGSVPKKAAFAAYVERLEKRPAYQRVKEINGARMPKG